MLRQYLLECASPLQSRDEAEAIPGQPAQGCDCTLDFERLYMKLSASVFEAKAQRDKSLTRETAKASPPLKSPLPPTKYKTHLNPKMHPKYTPNPFPKPSTENTKNSETTDFCVFFFVCVCVRVFLFFWFREGIRSVFWGSEGLCIL